MYSQGDGANQIKSNQTMQDAGESANQTMKRAGQTAN